MQESWPPRAALLWGAGRRGLQGCIQNGPKDWATIAASRACTRVGVVGCQKAVKLDLIELDHDPHDGAFARVGLVI